MASTTTNTAQTAHSRMASALSDRSPASGLLTQSARSCASGTVCGSGLPNKPISAHGAPTTTTSTQNSDQLGPGQPPHEADHGRDLDRVRVVIIVPPLGVKDVSPPRLPATPKPGDRRAGGSAVPGGGVRVGGQRRLGRRERVGGDGQRAGKRHPGAGHDRDAAPAPGRGRVAVGRGRRRRWARR